MKILKLFIRNTKNKTINYKTDNNLSLIGEIKKINEKYSKNEPLIQHKLKNKLNETNLDTSKSNQIIGEIKKINEKYSKNEPLIQHKLKNKLLIYIIQKFFF